MPGETQGRWQGSLWGHPTLSVVFCTPLPDQPFQGGLSSALCPHPPVTSLSLWRLSRVSCPLSQLPPSDNSQILTAGSLLSPELSVL